MSTTHQPSHVTDNNTGTENKGLSESAVIALAVCGGILAILFIVIIVTLLTKKPQPKVTTGNKTTMLTPSPLQ